MPFQSVTFYKSVVYGRLFCCLLVISREACYILTCKWGLADSGVLK